MDTSDSLPWNPQALFASPSPLWLKETSVDWDHLAASLPPIEHVITPRPWRRPAEDGGEEQAEKDEDEDEEHQQLHGDRQRIEDEDRFGNVANGTNGRYWRTPGRNARDADFDSQNNFATGPNVAASAALRGLHELEDDASSFIVWRVSDTRLELDLQLLSLSDNSRGTPRPLRFRFSAPVVPTVHIHEDASQPDAVVVTLLTRGMLCSLLVPLASFVSENRFSPHHMVSAHEVRRLRAGGPAPAFLHAASAGTFLVACRDGSVAVITLSAPGVYHDSVIPAPDLISQVKNNGITRLLSSAFQAIGSPRKGAGTASKTVAGETAASQPIAMDSCTVNGSTFAFSLCRDRKLRVYNVSHASCVRTLPAFSATSTTKPEEEGLLPSSPRSYVRVLRSPEAFDGSVVSPASYLIRLVVFVPSDFGCSFALIIAGVSPAGHITNLNAVHYKRVTGRGGFPLGTTSLGAELVDFQLLRVGPVLASAEAGAPMEKNEGLDWQQDKSLTSELWELWTLWNRQGVTSIRYTYINVPVEFNLGSTYIPASDRWEQVVTKDDEFVDPAYFEAKYFTKAEGTSISDIFLEYVFAPGRFSTSCIAKAVVKYETSLPDAARRAFPYKAAALAHSRLSRAQLKQDAEKTVARHVKVDIAAQAGATFAEDSRQQVVEEWRRFATFCAQIQRSDESPVALSISPKLSMVAVVKLKALSVVLACDQLEVVHHHSHGRFCTDLAIVPASSLVQAFPALAYRLADINWFILVSGLLRERLTAVAIERIDSEVRAVFSLPLSTALENIAADFWERILKEHLSDGKFRARVLEIFRRCDDAEGLLRSLIRMLRSPDPGTGFAEGTSTVDPEDMTLELEASTAAEALPAPMASIFADSLITDSVRQSAAARYDIARTVFIVLVIMSSVRESRRPIPDVSALLRKALVALHDSLILKWMSEQWLKAEDVVATLSRGDSPSPLLAEDSSDLARQLAGLRLRSKQFSIRPSAKAVPAAFVGFVSYSLLHVLLHKAYAVPVSLSTSRPAPKPDDASYRGDAPSAATPVYLPPFQAALQKAVATFLSSLEILDGDDRSIDHTTGAHVKLATGMETAGVPAVLLKRYLKFLDRSPGVEYLSGRCSLTSFDAEGAAVSLERAASGLVGRRDSSDTAGDLVFALPPDIITLGLPGYFKHVADLFEAAGLPEHVAAMSRRALNSVSQEEADTPAYKEFLKVVHHQLFTSSLELRNYEEAFIAIMNNPDQEAKRDNLRHFVGLLCENDYARKLCSQFTFVGLDDEVERTLEFKARNSDVLRAPNYYKILYSWHVFRGDYRNACKIMYQYGRRLGAVTSGTKRFLELAKEQAQSYLAAMNAMSLVVPEYAWVCLPKDATADGSPARKRFRLTNKDRPDFFGKEDALETEAPIAKDVEVVQLPDIHRDYLRVLAKLRLADKHEELGYYPASMDAGLAVELYSQCCLFDEAFTLALAHELDLRGIFESLSERCLALQRHSALPQNSRGGSERLAVSDEEAATWDGTPAGKAWKSLAKYLELHDDQKGTYRTAVVEKLLSVDPEVELPPWLTSFYNENYTEDLIRAYLKHDRVAKAATSALAHIRKLSNSPPASAPKWLPYSLIDSLLSALDEVQDERYRSYMFRQELAQVTQELRAALDAYFIRVRAESKTLLRRDGTTTGMPPTAPAPAELMQV